MKRCSANPVAHSCRLGPSPDQCSSRIQPDISRHGGKLVDKPRCSDLSVGPAMVPGPLLKRRAHLPNSDSAPGRQYLVAILGSRPSSRDHFPWHRKMSAVHLIPAVLSAVRVHADDRCMEDTATSRSGSDRQQSLQTCRTVRSGFWGTSLILGN